MDGYRSAEADRQIANLIQIGAIAGVNSGAAKASVTIGDITTHDIPVAQLRAGALSFWWMPAVGEQVLVVAPAGDMARAVVIASIFAGNAPSADAARPMIDLGGGTMVVNGDLEIAGAIRIQGDVISQADVTASGVSLKTHTHSGVGTGTANTGEPN